jgi:hypothetical protein
MDKQLKQLLQLGLLLMLPIISLGEVGRIYRGKMYDVENEEKVLDKSALMVLGLTLWDSSLKDAQEKIGVTQVKERGVRPRTETQICYEGSNSILVLTSPDAGEPAQRIQTVIVSRDKDIKERFTPCLESPKINKDLTFMGGLRLGMSRTEVKKILGKPGKITPGIMIYVIRRIQNEYFTDDVSIYLEFKNDKLTYVWASRTGIS